jgi:hypothetical protein
MIEPFNKANHPPGSLLELQGGKEGLEFEFVFGGDAGEFDAEAVGGDGADSAFGFKGGDCVDQPEVKDGSQGLKTLGSDEHSAEAEDGDDAFKGGARSVRGTDVNGARVVNEDALVVPQIGAAISEVCRH